MNMQKRSDERSKALHREIAKKLRNTPKLWAVPKTNIDRWKKRRKSLMPSVIEWEYILDKYSKEQILAILESDSEEYEKKLKTKAMKCLSMRMMKD